MKNVDICNRGDHSNKPDYQREMHASRQFSADWLCDVRVMVYLLLYEGHGLPLATGGVHH
jgi:hypothetical protein